MSVELTPEFVYEVWDNIKQDIPEKNREMVAKDLLITLEGNFAIDYDDMMLLKEMDKDLRAAVEVIYIEDENDEPDLSEWEDEY